jgi:hypothetical protein
MALPERQSYVFNLDQHRLVSGDTGPDILLPLALRRLSCLSFSSLLRSALDLQRGKQSVILAVTVPVAEILLVATTQRHHCVELPLLLGQWTNGVEMVALGMLAMNALIRCVTRRENLELPGARTARHLNLQVCRCERHMNEDAAPRIRAADRHRLSRFVV